MARRKREAEHENHERWLVSYADFITLLFAFFVVMYAISSVNEGKYRVLSDSLVNAFRNDPATELATIRYQHSDNTPKKPIAPLKVTPAPNTAHLQEEARRMRGMAGDLRGTLGPLIRDGKVRVTQSKRGIAVEISDSVLFETAKADLQPDSIAALSAVARLIRDTDNLVQVEGHTDNQPIASPQFPSNWELSAARAASVVRLFGGEGVAPQRMVAIGYGEYRPVEPNDSGTQRARNRRVTLNILADNRDEIAVLPADGANDTPPAAQ
ncbi:flagellar motor protein MotD [Chitinolyticbacter albus]|uniref:flagellar motor protein MotD n=1 Tax=Chitinolyticbacter albus TaxID=2961951 RepID=UPI00210D5BF1|nr:flagellar motor protein MotD [Chitinolyticbacter albus]